MSLYGLIWKSKEELKMEKSFKMEVLSKWFNMEILFKPTYLLSFKID